MEGGEEYKIEREDEEESSAKADYAQGAKITLPEIILTVSASSVADIAEFLGTLALAIPVIGVAIYGLCYIFGLVVSGGLFLWSSLRGVSGSFFVKRLVIMTAGLLADEATGGGLPIRTITLIIVIYLNNRFEEGTKNKILSGIEKGLKILGKAV